MFQGKKRDVFVFVKLRSSHWECTQEGNVSLGILQAHNVPETHLTNATLKISKPSSMLFFLLWVGNTSELDYRYT
ncbi:hypothetical protein PC119_g25098 [Phytophthora cactorum]|uniref:Uncharacterized protein n=1 Tax=Phytophthora cactorum TaxID=29920 RepID=A0A8T1APC7_9STRA|nr:hypothetical protein PC117_g25236 [Phytophthora cactorum]KAG2965021.1 hypothetical protein PC119_g25098 [Phytophthora cactorum]KAG3046059.1 hypothetical protein PC122_g24428 [Phytophthora cactorum]